MQASCSFILEIMHHSTSRDMRALSHQDNINKLDKLISLMRLMANTLKHKLFSIILI